MKPLLLPNQNKNKDENISLSISVSNLGPNLKSIWKIHIVTKNCKSGGKRLVSYKQCGNSKIFLPLRFYVKSNLAIFLDNKKCHFPRFRGLKHRSFGNFQPFQIWNYLKSQNSRPSKLPKIAVFELLNLSNLISRKF